MLMSKIAICVAVLMVVYSRSPKPLSAGSGSTFPDLGISRIASDPTDDLEFEIGGAAPMPTSPTPSPVPSRPTATQRRYPSVPPCPENRRVIDIGRDYPGDLQKRFKFAVGRANTIVRLAPDLDLDFSDPSVEWFPIDVGPCVTLTSVASFYTPQASEARTPHSRGPVLRYGPHREGDKAFLRIQSLPNDVAHDHIRIS